MANVYLFRHQAAGYLTEYPFAAEPSAEARAALERLCFQRHGASHPKTPDFPYWSRVECIPMRDPSDVPDVPERELGVVAAPAAAINEPVVAAVGVVTPRKKV